MILRPVLLACAAAAAIASTLALAAGPEHGHPNIIAAREATERAINRLEAAQKANEYDMGGHAEKAQNLLRQALEEMRAAAATDNRHDGR